jgi:hypothetical protein
MKLTNTKRFSKISYGGAVCNSIMKTRAFPLWTLVHVSTKTAPQPQQATPAPTPSSPGYPIGSMILGTGKANNVWIVNKDNSRDISLLWDGKQAKFCSNELERTDMLVASSHTVVTLSEVFTFIQSQIGNNKLPALPEWVKKLILSRLQLSKQTLLGGVYGHTIISPAAVQSMVKAGIADPSLLFKDQVKKQVDTVAKTCDHSFKSYIGFREVYQYCIKCDFKVQ